MLHVLLVAGAVALVIASALDLYSTQLALANGATEINPLAAFLQDVFPESLWWVPKMGITAIIVALAWLFPSWLIAAVLWAIVAVEAVVTHQNFRNAGLL